MIDRKAPEPRDDKPEPNVDVPEHLMPTEGGAFAEDPEGTTSGEHLRTPTPGSRPNTTSSPE
ncbi:hypothetical protein [Fimbriimonas ginsengisoli]|uniref:Uncharacterized protein n=1 Tax=Fimbriimonas ginsengisoli Gsoil 348 TaxID=661478 RepID=A0A068NQJ3_FIMGI|nr:hypothetical protein [Fimbriimonas ginsengisoli]AIE85627.1 hypothetical protein OP10G_2259 [Fimbriimonas ginsengisoli Gsoil 348]